MSDQTSEVQTPKALDAFEIRNFRTFEHLRIDDLGNVNLIVGRNNVGKTMLLEALRLHATQGAPAAILQLLSDRDEYDRRTDDFGRPRTPLLLSALFHGRPAEIASIQEIVLGPPAVSEQLLQLRLSYLSDSAGRGQPQLSLDIDRDEPLGPMAVEVLFAGKRRALLPFDDGDQGYERLAYRRFSRYRPDDSPAKKDVAFVPARGVHDATVADWWDAISLTDAEQRVVACLQIVTPVERIALVQHPFTRDIRVVMVKLKGEREPIPLRSLGDGLGRMFWIALAMERARDRGLLLIDEIENGIHYTALPTLWQFVAEAARLHDIQVFATSHSWDCVEGFQTALAENQQSRGVLIRLQRTRQAIIPTTFSERELGIVTRDKIEVRG